MGFQDFQEADTCEGGPEAKNILRDWLKRIAKSVELEGDIPLELWNVGHGADEAIYTAEWDVTEPIEAIVEELVEKAEEDALNVGRGSIRFKVVVEGLKKVGRAAFTLRIPKNNDLDSDDIEDIEELATRKGLMTQLMRHQEKTMKVGLGGSDKVMGHMTRLLESSYKRVAELEAQSLQNVKTYEELLSGKHVRDMELRKLDNSERRKEQVAGVLMQSVPVLLAKLMAKGSPSNGVAPAGSLASGEPGGPGTGTGGPGPEPVTELENMLEGFLLSFTPEQLKNIMESGVFTPPQMMSFVEIAKFVQDRMEVREASKAGQANGHASAAPQAPQASP